MPPDEKNRIEDLKQSLYSRSAPDIRTRRKLRFSDKESDVKHDWGDEPGGGDDMEYAPEHSEGQGSHFATRLLIGSAIFCVLALGAGAFVFFNGGNLISGNNISIDMRGPVSVPGGSPVSISVTVTNKNSVALQGATLVVHFPPGATDPNDTTQSLEEHKEDLGDLEPGASVTRNISAVIFGEQNTQKDVVADVTYGIAGSNSDFTKESTYSVVINASPATLSVNAPEETISGQPFDMTVDVKSDSTNTLKNVLLKTTYPFGFDFQSSSMSPANADGTLWAIGDMPPGGERKITIHGVLQGEDTDIKAFSFSLGAKSQSNPNVIGTSFVDTQQVVTIKKPFVSLSMALDDDNTRNDYVGSFGRPVNVKILWANNLPDTLTNVVITAHLSGNAYDKNNVLAWSGFYRSISDDVVWDQKTDPELASMAAGASGNLSFTITPSESQASDTRLTKPQITISVKASGDRVGSDNVPISTGSLSRNIKIISSPAFSSKILRSAAFSNTGPVPPVAEKQTTYAVDWDIEPSSNSLQNAVVTATLPPGVTWTGTFSPSSEDISYDKNSGTVTWNAGSVDAAGPSASRREVQFQVSLEPSVSQIGSAPILVNKSSFSATDSWTGTAVQSDNGFLTTSFTSDPTYKPGSDNVQPK